MTHLISRIAYLLSILSTSRLIHPSDRLRNLGVLFDSGLLFSKQINSIRKSSYFQMCDFVHIRRFLTKSVAITVANALVSSRIDYCNSLLNVCYDYDLCRLQGIQNFLSRIVLLAQCYFGMWFLSFTKGPPLCSGE